jgi:hypothetical protein
MCLYENGAPGAAQACEKQAANWRALGVSKTDSQLVSLGCVENAAPTLAKNAPRAQVARWKRGAYRLDVGV